MFHNLCRDYHEITTKSEKIGMISLSVDPFWDTSQETPMKTLQLLRAPLGMVRAL